MRILLLVLLCLPGFFLAAQDDSSRVLSLQEIKLRATGKTQGQKLIHFFRGNLGFTLEEMMARLPEMNFVRRGSYGMEPGIRSMSGGQINVMLDGMRIYGACTDKMDPATIYVEPANLDQIELQTGARKSFAGSNIGGLVNLKMAEPDFHGAPLQVSFLNGYQSAARAYNSTLRTQYHEGNMSVLATVTYRKAQDYRAGGGAVIPFSGYEKINYSLAVKYRLNDHMVIRAEGLGDDGWNIGYPALPMDVGYAAARIGSVTLEHHHASALVEQWKLKAYYNRIRHFMDDTHRPQVAMHMDMPGISQTSGVFIESSWSMPQKHHLQTRIDFSRTLQEASMTMYAPGQLPMYMLTWPDHHKNQGGLSADWSYQPDSVWTLQSAARADWVQYSLGSAVAKQEVVLLGHGDPGAFLLFNGSVGATRKLGHRLTAGLTTQFAQRAPTGAELFGFYLFNRQDNHDYLGNPALRKERSWQTDATITYQHKNLRLRITAFYHRISDYIFGQSVYGFSVMTIGAAGVKSYVNIPVAHIAGMEGSLLWKLNTQWQLVSTLKFNNGRMAGGEPLPMLQPWLNISAIRWNWKRWAITGEYEAAAPQKHVNSMYGEDATPAYLVVNFRLAYSFPMGRTLMDLQAGVENLADRTYHQHQDWGNIPRPGRNIYVQAKISF